MDEIVKTNIEKLKENIRFAQKMVQQKEEIKENFIKTLMAQGNADNIEETAEFLANQAIQNRLEMLNNDIDYLEKITKEQKDEPEEGNQKVLF